MSIIILNATYTRKNLMELTRLNVIWNYLMILIILNLLSLNLSTHPKLKIIYIIINEIIYNVVKSPRQIFWEN